MPHSVKPADRFMSRLAWGALLFNLAVIVWGAFVRASGSGAGCGSHWPLCNGQVIPSSARIATIIEYVHRSTSGLCLVLAAVVAGTGWRRYPSGHPVRRSSLAVLGFTLSEALIGAGLVLLRYVEKDQSVGRVISICLHLSNTFVLLAMLALTAWWSTYGVGQAEEARSPLDSRADADAKTCRLAKLAIALALLLGISGAVTALGDTLFQAHTLAQGITQDFAHASHYLVKLRVLHPILAVCVAAFLFHFAEAAADSRPAGTGPEADRLARLCGLLKGLVVAQLAIGALNLMLLAPTALQLVHLFVAESLWVAIVLTAAEATGLGRRSMLGAREAAPGQADGKITAAATC
jgi:heme A synthase